MIHKQVTLKEDVTIEGINVLNGRPNKAILHPANDDSGLAFLVDNSRIPAALNNAFNARHCGSSMIGLKNHDAFRRDVIKAEHMLSALYALGIDNAVIELSDDICPRLDHGVSGIIDKLLPMRIEGSRAKRFLTCRKPENDDLYWTEKEGISEITIKPATGMHISYTAEYPHKAIGGQQWEGEITEHSYRKHLSHCRSPFFLPLGLRTPVGAYLFLEMLSDFHGVRRSNSLIIGSRSNKRYIDNKTVLNDTKYGSSEVSRYVREEFVRHKALDFIGALALLGKPFADISFNVVKSGHDFDIRALRRFYSKRRFIGFEDAPAAQASENILYHARPSIGQSPVKEPVHAPTILPSKAI
ncbi:MAG TPA: UDP-3-O-acyl-N-acetylglucosamine deacetylase [Candidatus Nanoarchaeia archaeon]|nr:UDP-3-O-acyl-N-acetylglucosamine deacetylase [Candidatus Nanoarchaeia archaeon]